MRFQLSSTSRSNRLKPTRRGFWQMARLLLNVIAITIFPSLVSGQLSGQASHQARAQIIPDSTLPVNSAVPNGCSTCAITGGTLSNDQQTLFHSFQQFSVPTGGAALFQNSSSLVNIVTRVTGTLPSDIDGAIAAQGNANLFLLNPNGIIFGPHAVLQVPGSFIASSADSLIFADGTTFGATPSDTAPLLTVSTPMGLQFGTASGNSSGNDPGVIRVEGPGHFPPTLPGLFVTPGNTLALVGGQVEVEGGTVSAPSGRLEVGGVTQGTVKFTQSDRPGRNGLDLNFDQVQDFGTIHLSQGALLNASSLGASGGGGDIDLQGNTILVEEGSQVLSITTGALAGGQLRINAIDSVTVQGSSANGQVISRLSTDTGGAGAGGNLVVNTPQLRIRDRALLSASTGGSGKGGNLILNATDLIEIQGTGYEALQALFLNAIQGTLDISAVESGLLAGSGGAGDAGQLFIDTGQLHLQDGAIISTTTSGGGAGGSAEITATESVDIIGSIILTGALQGTTQKAGNLTLETERLGLHDGGLLQTFTLGSGDGGDLVVNASESVEVLDTPFGAIIPTGIFANSIFGTGTGGDIEVKTQQLTMTGGGQIGNQTGAFLGTGLIPFGGPAGDVILQVDGTTTITGLSADGRFGSGPGTSSFSGAPAGDVVLTTGNLFIQEGANISATTFSDGDGGMLSVDVTDVLELSGTGIRTASGMPVSLPSSLVSSSGRADFPGLVGHGAAGTLQVSAGELIIREGAAIAIDSLGSGDAGTLTATADLIRLDTGGNITAATAAGTGGNVVLRTPVLLLRHGSNLNTDAGNADGGNITLDTGLLIALENSDITANALQGRGGQVNVTAQSIFGTAFREELTLESDITATSALGPEFNGEVVLNTPDLDPDSGLVRLPAPAGDPNDQIIAGCTGDRGNRFVMAGQGGVPTAPNQRLEPSGSWQDLRFLNRRFLNGMVPDSNHPDAENRSVEKQSPTAEQPGLQPETIESETSPIREASLIQTNEQGEIVLAAQPSTRLALRNQATQTSGECAAH
ncbi:MAG: S-layer family protein [Cyanobacteria bacterium P01_F01_bin.53]